MQSWTEAKQYTDPEKMAAAYLVKYYGNQKIFMVDVVVISGKKKCFVQVAYYLSGQQTMR